MKNVMSASLLFLSVFGAFGQSQAPREGAMSDKAKHAPTIGLRVSLKTLAAAVDRTDAIAKGLSEDIVTSLRSGQAVDLLVVFDAEEVTKGVTVSEATNDGKAIEQRAAAYASLKSVALATYPVPGSLSVLKDYSHLPLMLVRFRSEDSLRALLQRSDVVAIRAPRSFKKLLAQSLPLIGQPAVAASGKKGAGTTVAVIDTGVDYTKAAFGPCTAPGSPSSCKVAYAQDFAPDDGTRDSGRSPWDQRRRDCPRGGARSEGGRA